MREPLSIPCSCGSGKPLKHCCLFKNQKIPTEQNIDIPDYTGVTVFYGFTKEYAKVSPFEIDFKLACCQVIQANPYLANLHNQMIQFNMLKPGDWFVMGEEEGQMKFSFRYSEPDDAMDIAREKFGAIRFLQSPEIF
ncbi:hypothetical protein EXU34_07360 [Alteromonas sp. ZYF713]|nr:hypothetical protein [Alteromonas sp. ZYF713]